MSDIDDKLKSLIEDIHSRGWSEYAIKPDEYIKEIYSLFPVHGVCADCSLFNECQSTMEWPLMLDEYDGGQEYDATKIYCSEFEPKE